MQHSLTQRTIDEQVNASLLFCIRVLTAVFAAIAIVLSLVFAVAITALIILHTVLRIALTVVLSHRQTRITFAAIGGHV